MRDNRRFKVFSHFSTSQFVAFAVVPYKLLKINYRWLLYSVTKYSGDMCIDPRCTAGAIISKASKMPITDNAFPIRALH